MRRARPDRARFLEVGVEVAKGIDRHAAAWASAGLPTTYHFLDVNLDDPDDLDPGWLEGVRGVVQRLQPAWMCGDAGLWHVGPRDRTGMVLLPPVLTREVATAMAGGIRALRAAVGREVLPENPPGTVWLGDLHLLEYFAALAEEADTGLLIDVAHLVIYQHTRGGDPFDGFDVLPLDRVVEVHVAGGTPRVTAQGFSWIDDDHGLEVLPATWTLLERLVALAPNLRAVVLEAERNPVDALEPVFDRLERTLAGWGPP